MKRAVKGLFCGAVASVVLLNSGFSVGAAGLKDIFDAEYYAEQYPDLKKAFGSDEEALYQHFINYGIKEGRVMNPVIDVVKYREQYKDLQAAFGDDWDAYINHYFTYGVNEHRENGTDFDLLAYLNAYGDLQAAFGNDYVAIAKHYEETGIKENRSEGSKAVMEARAEAAREAAKAADEKKEEATDNNTNAEEDVTRKVSYEKTVQQEDGSWIVEQYDDRDALLTKTAYKSDGSVDYYATFDFDDNLILRKRIIYEYREINGVNVVRIRHERIYDEYGRVLADNHYGVDPNTNREEFLPAISQQRELPPPENKEGDFTVYEYDETTKTLKTTRDYYGNGIYNISDWVKTVQECMPNGIRQETIYHYSGMGVYPTTRTIDDKDCTDMLLDGMLW